MANTVWDDLKFQVLHTNNVLIKLIAINVVFFIGIYVPIALMGLGGRDVFEGALSWFAEWFYVPADLGKLLTRPWTLVSYFFLHSFSIGHILWNMLFLYWFGRVFHNLMGNNKTLALYLVGGFSGGVVFVILSQFVPIMSTSSGMVGASGAVMAVVVGAATLTPNYQIRLLFLGNVKLWWIAAFHVLGDLLYISMDKTGGRVAHLTGALIGYLYVTQLQKGNDIGGWTVKVVDFFASAFRPKPKTQFKVHRTDRQRTGGRSTRTAGPAGNVSQEQVDAILDKIAQSGYDSLTAKEKEILFKASGK